MCASPIPRYNGSMARLDKLREAIYQRKFEEPTRPPEDDLPLGLPDRGKPLPLSWGKNGNRTPALPPRGGGPSPASPFSPFPPVFSSPPAGPGGAPAGGPAVFKIAVVNRGRVL